MALTLPTCAHCGLTVICGADGRFPACGGDPKLAATDAELVAAERDRADRLQHQQITGSRENPARPRMTAVVAAAWFLLMLAAVAVALVVAAFVIQLAVPGASMFP